jgi:thiol-disulfide isomerase/thioredoxin
LNRRHGAIFALALAAAAGGFWAYLHRGGSTPRAVDAGKPPLAAKQLAATLPEFSLMDREGRTRSLHDWAGKSLVINFWATWCAPCRKEIPLLQKLQRERAGEGFQVIGIAVDFSEPVLAYAGQMKIEYPLLIGEQDALDAVSAFGIEMVGLPFTVFSDHQGRIVAAHMGELTAADANLILGEVRAVDAGRKSLVEARSAIESGRAALPAPAESRE